MYTDDNEYINDVVNQVLSEGIELENGEYLNNKKYNQFRYKDINIGLEGYVSYDYIIEKCYLGQEKINKIKGIYDIGTKRNLNKKQLELTSLCNCILERISDDNKGSIDLVGNNFDNVRQKFIGLITKLKNFYIKFSETEMQVMKKIGFYKFLE